MSWMRNERMRRLCARSPLARRLLIGAANLAEIWLLAGHKPPEVVRSIRRAQATAETLLSSNESFVVRSIGEAQSALDGDFAELGVYQGASARLLCEVKGERPLHLFDTFDGLPAPSGEERRVFAHGQFRSALERVRERLAPFADVHLHAGLFPGTGAALADRRFAFVHLDVDLEHSTRAGLDFFYQRMVPGGIILAHDYSIIPGVKRAIDCFMHDKPERLIELPTTQAMMVRQA